MKKRVFLISFILVIASIFISCDFLGKLEVQFDSMGGSKVNSVKVSSNSLLSKPKDPVKENYLFVGWFKEEECINPWNFDLDIVAKAMTLYANWAGTVIVNFDKNSETAIGRMYNQAFEANKPTKINENKFENSGYTFVGWALEKNGEALYFDQDLITVGEEGFTLYAVWKAQVTIAFDKNSAYAKGKMKTLQVSEGSEVKLPKNLFTLDDNIFAGWARDLG